MQEDTRAAVYHAVVIRTGPGLYLARILGQGASGEGATASGEADGVPVGTVWACKLRGKLGARLLREGEAVYIGEEVLIGHLEGKQAEVAGMVVSGTALIDSLLPRRTTLARLAPPPWPGTTLLKQTLAVNVDLMVAVVAAVAPPLKVSTVNRYLLLAEQAGLDRVVCINKIDQAAGSAEMEKVLQAKSDLEARGVRVALTSAATGEGIPELHALLQGRTSVFTGPSGVGKTSILMNLCPGLEAKTLSISSANKKGRHSTTYSSLIDIGGGYVADLPGLRAIGFWNMEEGAVKSAFPDIEELARDCQFSDCSHRGEPGCAVRAAIEAGDLSEERFEEYLRVLRDSRRSRAGQEREGKPGRKFAASNRRVERRLTLREAEEELIEES